MKKKVVRRRKKRSSPSLKNWLLLCLLVFSVAAATFLTTRPKTKQVLQVAGSLEDYIPANPVDINIVKSLKDGSLPMSDDPEAHAMAVANQYVRQKIARGEEVDEDKVEQVAIQAARDAYQQGAASGAIDASVAIAATKSTNDKPSKAETEGLQAAAVVNSLDYVRTETGQVVVSGKPPATGQTSATGGSTAAGGSTCSTSAFSVYEGETMVGTVVTAADGSKQDSIVVCRGGKWVAVVPSNGVPCYEGDKRPECKISVLPMYAQKDAGRGPNCYVEGGSVVVGNGSVVEVNNGTGKRCDGTKDLTIVVQHDNDWVTPKEKLEREAEAKKKAEEDEKKNREACVASGREWDDKKTTCTDSAPAIDKRYTTPYSLKGCDSALNKDAGETCVKSKDNPNLYLIVPKGGIVGNSGVVANTSSEISTGPRAPVSTTTFSQIECDKALAQSGAGFSCEPIAGGNYYKLTPKAELPLPQRDLTPFTFGSNADGLLPGSATTNDDANCQFGGTVVTGGQYRCYCDASQTKWSNCGQSDSIPAGDECATDNDDSSCQSGECKKGIKPGTTSIKWYCMADTNVNSVAITTAEGKTLQANGSYCQGNNSVCASGFCEINTGLVFGFMDKCADNPFVDPSTVVSGKTRAEQLLENNQDKYDLIIGSDPGALKEFETSLAACQAEYGVNTNSEINCVQVPGRPLVYVPKDSINNVMNELDLDIASTGSSLGSEEPDLPPGAECEGSNDGNACTSGECSRGVKPGDSQIKWYCMADTNINNSSRVTSDGEKLKANDSFCYGQNSDCASGFCQRNPGLPGLGGMDRCADNPFVDPATASNKTRAEQQIENNQEKYELIIAKDPDALVEYENSLAACQAEYGVNTNTEINCVQVPGRPLVYVPKKAINDQANNLGVSLKAPVNTLVTDFSECESGVAADLGAQFGGLNFKCKPKSFCPEQDLENGVRCDESGKPICAGGDAWSPGVDCSLLGYGLNTTSDPAAANPAPPVAVVGQPPNSYSNPFNQEGANINNNSILPTNFPVLMQDAAGIGNVNINLRGVETPYDTIMATSGCAPATLINALRYLEKEGEISPLGMTDKELLDKILHRSNFTIACTADGCSSGADAVLAVMEREFGIDNAFSEMGENIITSTTDLENVTGLLIYQGDVSNENVITNNPTGLYGHNSSLVCDHGKCVSIDSYESGGTTHECTAIDENNLKCGPITYKFSTESRQVGGPSAAYLVPLDGL